MIILNETSWAEEMIEKPCIIGDRHECLRRIARYYMDSSNDKVALDSIASKVAEYLGQCSGRLSVREIRHASLSAVKSASRYPAVNIGHIPISSTEIQIIRQLKGKQLRRVAFTLLCISKYWDFVREHNDHWTHNDWSEIMKMANVNTSIKRQAAMFCELNRLGMIQLSKKVDNLNMRVLFADNHDEAYLISDFRSLGYQYLIIVGEPYFYCKRCGVATKYTSQTKGRQVYCPECAYKSKLEKNASLTSASAIIRATIDSSHHS